MMKHFFSVWLLTNLNEIGKKKQQRKHCFPRLYGIDYKISELNKSL